MLVDGKVSAAVGEERLNRNKMHLGFPWLAIKEVLRIGGVGPESLDAVIVPHNAYLRAHPFFVNRIMRKDPQGVDVGNEFGLGSLAREILSQIKSGGHLSPSLSRMVKGTYARNAFQGSLEELGICCKLLSIDHHLAHAASAYYTSGFDECLVFTFDGSGDGLSHTTSIGRGGFISRLASTSEIFSPGVFYSAVTKFLGYQRHNHEGKITGLAAFGDPEKLYPFFTNVLCLSGDERSFSSKLNFEISPTRKVLMLGRLFSGSYFRSPTTNYLLDVFQANLGGESPENIAAAAQKVLEDSTISLIKHALKETGLNKIALAGGVCANVKLNQKILEIDGVEEVYIHPNMGDGGCAFGGALMHHVGQMNKIGQTLVPQRFSHVYWGPEYTDGEIHAELTAHGLEAEHSNEIESETAECIARGFIVGRFNGRMEYGPRALGNRSVLARANDKKVPEMLNQRLNRTDFMPFAPSILKEHAPEYYENMACAMFPSEFMTITYRVKREHKSAVSAVTHVDSTARPHVVREDINPSYYRILSHYKERTGFPVILNTSFNTHDDPIVCTPKDAVRSFLAGCIDVLSIGNFIVKQPGANK
ncbi:hypothetical protein UR09_05280 [Candidatus Nitromaritima sp. SCGC AAA799-A02]|nr:hypothetical protein UR09_05280 [Candidatus Nitromaritima sp. SCGC AAA799-A02]